MATKWFVEADYLQACNCEYAQRPRVYRHDPTVSSPSSRSIHPRSRLAQTDG
jgi:hypothetical protein